ncbi:MAG: helix-turn-helix transcriptional regulator [Betaproteobacteria bacterium]|nr:helix-turn-helix transcriptional regulator [Betaproteobacteria bacterium]
MKTKPPPLFHTLERRLTALGERLRLARMRRKFSAETVAKRAGVSRMTLYRIESGDPVVALGSYARVLAVLQLDSDLEKLALDDALGRRLQDLGIAPRRRAPRRAGVAQPREP